MTGKHTILTALLAIAILAGNLAPTAALAQTAERTAAIPRPDLALGARDLPPGFEERSPEFMRVGDVSIEDRLLVRSGGGLGAYWVWNATYQPTRPVTEESLARSSQNIAVILSRTFSENVHLADWEDVGAAGIGDLASLRSFRYHNLATNYEADGALLVFARGDVLTVLAALSTDGRATADVRRLARLLDSRIRTSL